MCLHLHKIILNIVEFLKTFVISGKGSGLGKRLHYTIPFRIGNV